VASATGAISRRAKPSFSLGSLYKYKYLYKHKFSTSIKQSRPAKEESDSCAGGCKARLAVLRATPAAALHGSALYFGWLSKEGELSPGRHLPSYNVIGCH
jgi:hypothetical protein